MRKTFCAMLFVAAVVTGICMLPSCNDTEQALAVTATQDGAELAVPLSLNLIGNPDEEKTIAGIIDTVSTDALALLSAKNSTQTIQQIVDKANPKAAAILNYVLQVLPSSSINAALNTAIKDIPSNVSPYLVALFTGAKAGVVDFDGGAMTVSASKAFKSGNVRTISFGALKATLATPKAINPLDVRVINGTIAVPCNASCGATAGTKAVVVPVTK